MGTGNIAANRRRMRRPHTFALISSCDACVCLIAGIIPAGRADWTFCLMWHRPTIYSPLSAVLRAPFVSMARATGSAAANWSCSRHRFSLNLLGSLCHGCGDQVTDDRISKSTVWVKKSSPLKLFAIFSLRLSIFPWNFASMFSIHIYTYLPIVVNLSSYLTKWH